ncbi:hypothetical protein FJTKL_05197 [Diaporthe vaccinii]|uniref:Uncharacterized protein n=1 Tax=Diaporthe vaccinii TaxID=105482 RepID=A0ABR4FEY4_9PEZI
MDNDIRAENGSMPRRPADWWTCSLFAFGVRRLDLLGKHSIKGFIYHDWVSGAICCDGRIKRSRRSETQLPLIWKFS